MDNKKSITKSKITEGNTPKSASIRLTESEGEKLEKLRTTTGLSTTDLVKRALFSDRITVCDRGADILSALAGCAEAMNEIRRVLERKDVSDVGIKALLIDLKDRQIALGSRFEDIEERISDIIMGITEERSD